MKKKLVLLSLMSALMLIVVACAPKKKETTTKKTVKIATPVMAKDGYVLELVQVNDNIQYNELLNNQEVDANFAQHQPFMEKFNEERQANLVAVQKIYDAKVGFYAKEAQTIEDIPEGSKVALPSDVSNEGRALAILADAGLITLKQGVGFEGTLKDIEDNPKKFQWLSVDLLNLAETYDEAGVSLVYNYPAYIAKIGLTPADALILEKKIDQRFAISLVAREDNQDSAEIKALKKAMTSPEVKDYLEKEHGETTVPAF